MHGTKEERLAIGKRVHDGELTRSEASKEYGVPERTIREWEANYRESIGEKKTRRLSRKTRTESSATKELLMRTCPEKNSSMLLSCLRPMN